MSLKFYYGIKTKNIEVTNIVMNNCRNNDILFIQSDDLNRDKLFGDPVVGVLKSIYIQDLKSNDIYEYDANTDIYIDLNIYYIKQGHIS